MESSKKSVLFICLGNICRSPIAEAVFLKLLKEKSASDKWVVDSAAVIDYHVGKGPEKRTLQTLRKNGISDYKHIVRQVSTEDFRKFDFILGMDDDNIRDLNGLAEMPEGRSTAAVKLLGEFDPKGERVIPDPYYESGTELFDTVYRQCERACRGFFDAQQ